MAVYASNDSAIVFLGTTDRGLNQACEDFPDNKALKAVGTCSGANTTGCGDYGKAYYGVTSFNGLNFVNASSAGGYGFVTPKCEPRAAAACLGRTRRAARTDCCSRAAGLPQASWAWWWTRPTARCPSPTHATSRTRPGTRFPVRVVVVGRGGGLGWQGDMRARRPAVQGSAGGAPPPPPPPGGMASLCQPPAGMDCVTVQAFPTGKRTT